MIVQPWGRIKGTRTNRGRPVAGEKIMVELDWRTVNSSDFKTSPGSGIFDETTTDSKGNFVFDHVPPLGLMMFEKRPWEKAWDEFLGHFQITPGENKFFEFAEDGREIVGQLQLTEGLPGNLDLQSCQIGLIPASTRHAPIPAIPKEYDTTEKRIQWCEDWYQSDLGKAMFGSLGHESQFEVQSNGVLISDLVVDPGKYLVDGELRKGRERLAEVDQYVVIPSDKPGNTNDVFDIGKVMLTPALQIGNICPDFDVPTLDGKSLKLSDFRDKYVLLDFWATWCGPCVRETPNLKATFDAFGKNARFAMISLSLDEDMAAPRKFVKRNGIPWMQGFLGDWDQDHVTKDFEVSAIPSIWLIGPDGKLISRNLRGLKIKEAVAAALNGGKGREETFSDGKTVVNTAEWKQN